MANIINQEGNLELEISLNENDMLDYKFERSDYENWIPFTLCLNIPDRCSTIGENAKATLTIFEIENLIQGIKDILVYFENQKKYIYAFSSCENFFELKLETIPMDNVIEIELWINVSNQTKGEIYGFDEGVRFVTDKSGLSQFFKGFKNNYLKIKNKFAKVVN